MHLPLPLDDAKRTDVGIFHGEPGAEILQARAASRAGSTRTPMTRREVIGAAVDGPAAGTDYLLAAVAER
jgi:hypothetical protein